MIVVVGAGFAGLSAARTLSKRGKNVCVLEARSRVGGRAYTEQLPNGPWVDLGGQWIGPTQDHILELVAEFGIPTFPTHTAGHNLLEVNGKLSKYRGTIPRLPIFSLLSVGWAQWRLERMSKRVPLDAPWKAKRAAEWDAISLGDWMHRNVATQTAKDLFEAALETVFAAPARDISLLHALFYIHSGKNLDILLGTEGGAQATRIDGGMQRVATRLAEGLDVRLETPVRAIEQDARGVRVRTDKGTIEGTHAIVALPPKLAVALGPEARKRELLEKMPMGAVIKHTAVYERPFWRDAGLSGLVVSDRGPIHVAFDNSPPDGPGVLMGFSEADAARILGKKSKEEREAIAVETFARFFGVKSHVAYTDHVWEHDEWSGGCYGAFMPPGLWTSLGPRLREPTGRIHWAGTETSDVWSGYIDGALRSGVRAASEVA